MAASTGGGFVQPEPPPFFKDDEMKCSACGGTEYLRPGSPWHKDKVICNPCFMVWYDGPQGMVENFDPTSAASVGEASLKLKALGRFPWTGRFAPKELSQ